MHALRKGMVRHPLGAYLVKRAEEGVLSSVVLDEIDEIERLEELGDVTLHARALPQIPGKYVTLVD
jgi:hypothetical protein